MPGLQTALAPRAQSQTTHSPVSRLEYGVLFAILIVFSEGILPRLVSNEQAAEGSPVLRYLWLPVYAVTFAGLLWKARDIVQVCLRLPFLMALLALCALSFIWSIDPGLSQRRSVAMLMTS
ncbi:MAG: hypothetical protein AAGB16_04205, partial [Pseudomonadota bacterium]